MGRQELNEYPRIQPVYSFNLPQLPNILFIYLNVIDPNLQVIDFQPFQK